MFQQLLVIAGNTFKEGIRQPVYAVLTLVALLALGLNPSLAAFTLDDDNRLLIDIGLSTLLVAGLLLAGFTATAVLGRELDHKTVLTVISKPVSRPLFIVGKYVGVVAAVAVAYWTLGVVFLLSVRHGVLQTARDAVDGPVVVLGVGAAVVSLAGAALGNYWYRWVFGSSLVLSLAALESLAYGLVLCIDRDWAFQPIGTEFAKNGGQLPQLVLALLLNFESLLVLTALAIAAATRLERLMTLAVCGVVFVLGLVGGGLFAADPGGRGWGKVLGFVVPNLQLLWVGEALGQSQRLGGGYVLLAVAYAGLFVVAVLAVAVALFQRHDVG